MDGETVRHQRQEHYEAIRQLHLSAFGRPEEVRLTRLPHPADNETSRFGGLNMAMSEFFGWLGAVVMVGGLALECAALIATRFYSLARCLPFQAVGGILFYVGVAILIASRAL